MPRLLAAIVVVVLAACGGSKSPTVPQLANANIVTRGQMTFSTCSNFSGCWFQGEAVNNGPGCAANVRGVSRLLNEGGTEVGRAEWSLPPSRRINAREAFLYEGCCFSLNAVNAPGTYRTDVTWDDVRC